MAIGSASNTASSLRAPPPRITTTASSGRHASSSIAACDHRHGVFTLDPDVAHRQLEPDGARLELVLEVVPRRAADARDDADAQRDGAEPPAPVAFDEPAGDEPAQHLVPLLGEIAEREAGVDAAHLQRQPAVWGVEVELPVDAHLHPVAEHEMLRLSRRRSRSRCGAKKATGITALDSDWSSASVK